MPKNQLRRIIDSKRSSDGLVLMTGVPASTPGGGGVTDHGMLSGLADNDHPQYLLATTASTTYALRSVTVTMGAGLTGATATLASNFTINIGAGNGIVVGTDTVGIKLPANSGLFVDGNGLKLTPTSITLTSDNTPDAEVHSHVIVTSSNPANAQILASDVNGMLGLKQLTTPIVTSPAATNLQLKSTADIILDPAGQEVLPATPYFVNLGSLQNKYLMIHAAELWVETLVAQETIATIGGRILVGPTTVLEVDLAATEGASTITVKHNQMQDGDIVYMEARGKVEFMEITSGYTALGPSGSGPYRYDVTRSVDATPSDLWYKGDAIFNTGTINDGFIDLYSISSIRPGGFESGPTIVGNVRTGTTYNAWQSRWAIGNLNGLYGYGTAIYGFAAGVPSGAWIAAEATNGFRIMSGANVRTQVDISGNLFMFAGTESDPNKATIALYNNGRAYFNNRLLIGQDGELRQGLIWVHIGPGVGDYGYVTDDGRDFINEAGVLTAKFNGLRIWQAGGIGYIGGYRAGVQQWQADNEGMISAGGGKVLLQQKGLTFKYASDIDYASTLGITQNAVSWMADQLNDINAAANIVGGTHTEGGGGETPFLRLTVNKRGPEVDEPWVAIESRSNGNFFWFSGFNFVSGLPGVTLSRNLITNVSTATFGQDGAGDWFIIAENTTTRVGGHWVPTTDVDKFLGVPSLRWAQLWAHDIHSTGKAYLHDVEITGSMTGDATESFAEVYVAGDMIIDGTVDGVRVSAFNVDYLLHVADTNIHHNRIHNLLADDHYITGQEAGDVLIVTGPTTFDFFPLTDAIISALDVADTASINMTWSGGTLSAVVIPGGVSHDALANISANDHHNQQHALDGTDHTGVLSWAKVDKTGSNLTDIATRAHSSLTGIGANDHHAQSHALDGTDHSGFLSWGKVDKTGSDLAHLQTKAHSSLSGIGPNDHHSQVHSLVSANHTVSGLTVGHFLKAFTVDTFGFGSIGLTDLPVAGSNYAMLRSDGAGATDWEPIGGLAGNGLTHLDGVLNVAPGTLISVSADTVDITDAPGPFHMIWSPAFGDHEWHPIGDLAGAGLVVTDGVLSVNVNPTLTLADDTLGVNLANNFVWTGTHQFENTVQINNTLTTQTLLPALTDTYDIGSVTMMYRASWISTMNAVIFAENTAQLIGGWFIIPKHAGKLGPVAFDQTVIDFGPGITFALNDVVLVRAHTAAGGGAVAAEYMTIGTNAGGTTWNVTRDTSGGNTPDPVWPDGTPYLLLGKMGDGRIELDAQNGQRISIIRQASDAYNSGEEVIRIGELSNTFAYGATQTWGMTFGKYGVAANTWLTLDIANGIRFGNNTDVIGRWDTTGKVTIGKVANLEARVEIDSTYGFRIIFKDGAAVDQVLIHLAVSGNATLEGVLGLGLNGGIYQGTGTFGTPTIGLKIWNDAGIGRFATYNAGAVQVSVNTTGQLTAGGGLVILDQSGVSIKSSSSFSTQNSVKFIASNTTEVVADVRTANFFGTYRTELQLRAFPFGVTPPMLTGTGAARISLLAYANPEETLPGAIELRTFTVNSYNIDVMLNNSLSIVMSGSTITITGATVTVNGTLSATSLTSTRIIADSGTAALPPYTFSASTNTGMWYSTSQINMSIAGTNRLSLGAAGLTVTGILNVTGLGSSGAAAIGWSSGAGMYKNGTRAVITGDTAWSMVASDSQGLFAFGTQALPSVSFETDPDTGMYHYTTDVIGWATAGATAMTLDSVNNLVVYGNARSLGMIYSTALTGGFSAIGSGALSTSTPYRFNDTHGTGLAGVANAYVGLAANNNWHLLTRADGGGDSYLRLGYGIITTDRNSYVDFHTNATVGGSYTARIIRNAGADGNLIISNVGTGILQLYNNGVSSLVVNNLGNIAMNSITVTSVGATGNIASSGGNVTGVRVGIGPGSVGAPGLYFTGDVDTGIYAVGTGQINFTVDGVSKAVLSSAGLDVNGPTVTTRVSVQTDGGGVTSSITYVYAFVTAAGAGVGSLKMTGATARTNAGYIKAYIDTTAIWIPYFTAI